MNVSTFLRHWSISENPFRAEEARHDPVFMRLGVGVTTHPDFDKILGDPAHPSTSIVFGEKGSGKTAIRLQISERIAEHNLRHPDSRVLLAPYDDLNPVLDRVCARQGVTLESKAKDIVEALRTFRLVDHMDAITASAVTSLTDAAIGGGTRASTLGDDVARRLRRTSAPTKRDLVLLQAVYDSNQDPVRRAARLRRSIGAPVHWIGVLWKVVAAMGWLLPVAVWLGMMLRPAMLPDVFWQAAFFTLSGAWALVLLYVLGWQAWMTRRTAARIARQMPAVGRSAGSIAASLAALAPGDRRSDVLPVTDSDEQRYAMFDRLRAVLLAMGCPGLIVVVDRVDEPTLVNGDPDRMRAIIWPMLHNKFLQQEGIGLKLLLPIELRHELFRESSVFFQEARLDKQSLVERLTWTGAMLYDLCNARLNACLEPNGERISLGDLFEKDVTRQDIIDALDQMHQPRDAFKLIYQCIQDHCSNVAEEQAQWKIPRLVLETTRRQQADRVQDFYRGVRPA